MQKELGTEIKDDKKRIEFLSDNCDSIEQKGYMKRFSPLELLRMKEELAETAIEINDIEEQKKSEMEVFKIRMKPLVEDRKLILTGLKNKSEHVTERCFKFIDMEQREVGFYTENGELIESRPAYADELQGTIFQVLKQTGTDNE